ncbi:hypothetical protein NQ317_007042 [Molorchus minor]|uniref:Ferritin n=1 Tax=Molorchus minor TaxID=1323400 RepID=A0ABQ9JG13_9CUCU|nr:hypothetical protein NQ317_007042 [Molorchus minor]
MIKTLLSFRTSILLKKYENLLKPFTPQIKYYTKDCSEDDTPGRHQYHKDVEEAINQQICAEFNAAYAYLSMACYFGRTELALPGCQGFFMDMWEEELEHATVFINFQLMRGAHVRLAPINVPESQDWKSIVNGFGVAVDMEKLIKEKLCGVFQVAEKHKDLQVMDLVSTQFMEEQNRSICELSRLLTMAKMADNPTGEYLFDKLLYNNFVEKSKDNAMYKTKLDLKEDKVYK